MQSTLKSGGALALVAGGIAAAFALAACCALPLLLVGVGLSPYWLAPAASVGERYGNLLTVISVASLIGAVVVVARSPRTCEPGSLCARSWFRIAVAVLAVIGAALLAAGHVHA